MGKKILVVDNSELFRIYMEDVLKEQGHDVRVAPDGLSALLMLDEFTPDIFFIDLIMQHIRGDKLCALVRQRPEHEQSYLVIISAVAAEIEIDFKSLKADACIAKGPLNKMKPLILDAVAEASKPPGERGDDRVRGLENIYQRNVTKELLAIRKHSDIILQNIDDGVIELRGEKGRIVYANRAAVRLLGMSESELLTREFSSLFSQEDQAKVTRLLPSGFSVAEVHEEVLIKREDLYFTMTSFPVHDDEGETMIVIQRNVTENKRALEKKNILMREIYHRVKNNLAMVVSIINLQSMELPGTEYQLIFDELRNRLEAIMLVHEKLYKTDDLTNIDIDEFIADLLSNLVSSNIQTNNVQINRNIVPVTMDPDTTIVLGLIITELVTNSLKYAFPEKHGTVSISLQHHRDGEFLLEVKDDGTGFPPDFELSGCHTLGLKLVHGLAQQFGSGAELDNSEGACFRIPFRTAEPR